MDELYYQGTHSGPEIDALLDTVDAGVVPAYGKGINLLRNWYFVGGGSQQGGRQFPLNERGQTSYSGSVYTIDRWKNTTGTLTVIANGVKLNGVAHYLPKGRVSDGLVYTVSVLSSKGLATLTRTLNSSVSGWQISTTFGDTGWVGVRFSNSIWDVRLTDSSGGIVFYAAKLELGDTQTLAHQENGVWVLNDPAPNFEEELFRCQTSHADSSDTYANKSYATGNLIGKVLGNPAGQNVAVGEYAIVNNELYVCNTAITSSMTPSTYMSYLTQKSGGAANALITPEQIAMFSASAITSNWQSGTSAVDSQTCAYKLGRLVLLTLYIKVSTAVPAWTTICTLDDAIKYGSTGGEAIYFPVSDVWGTSHGSVYLIGSSLETNTGLSAGDYLLKATYFQIS